MPTDQTADPHIANPDQLREQYSLAIPDPSYLRPDDEIEGSDECPSVAGYVIARPVSRMWREFWCENQARWVKMKTTWENGVLETRHPRIATVYGDYQKAVEVARQVSDVECYICAVRRELPIEEAVRRDRDIRRGFK